MPRYVAIKRVAFEDRNWAEPPRDTISVIEDSREPQKTGLFDKDGNELFKMPECKPIGFTADWADD